LLPGQLGGIRAGHKAGGLVMIADAILSPTPSEESGLTRSLVYPAFRIGSTLALGDEQESDTREPFLEELSYLRDFFREAEAVIAETRVEHPQGALPAPAEFTAYRVLAEIVTPRDTEDLEELYKSVSAQTPPTAEVRRSVVALMTRIARYAAYTGYRSPLDDRPRP